MERAVNIVGVIGIWYVTLLTISARIVADLQEARFVPSS